MRTKNPVVVASLLTALLAAMPLAAADPTREQSGLTFDQCAVPDPEEAAACVITITSWCTSMLHGYDSPASCLVDHAGTSSASNPTRIDPPRSFVQCATAPVGETEAECAAAIVAYCTEDEHGYDSAAACLLDHIGTP